MEKKWHKDKNKGNKTASICRWHDYHLQNRYRDYHLCKKNSQSTNKKALTTNSEVGKITEYKS